MKKDKEAEKEICALAERVINFLVASKKSQESYVGCQCYTERSTCYHSRQFELGFLKDDRVYNISASKPCSKSKSPQELIIEYDILADIGHKTQIFKNACAIAQFSLKANKLLTLNFGFNAKDGFNYYKRTSCSDSGFTNAFSDYDILTIEEMKKIAGKDMILAPDSRLGRIEKYLKIKEYFDCKAKKFNNLFRQHLLEIIQFLKIQ